MRMDQPQMSPGRPAGRHLALSRGRSPVAAVHEPNSTSRSCSALSCPDTTGAGFVRRPFSLSHRPGQPSSLFRPRPSRSRLHHRVGLNCRSAPFVAAPGFFFQLSHHVCQDLAESPHRHIRSLSSAVLVGFDANKNGLTHGTRSLPPDGKTYD